MTIQRVLFAFLLLANVCVAGCATSSERVDDSSGGDGDADGDTDGDSDGDSDGDADGDSDGDADGDSDGDTDSDTDSDTDTDTDSDTDSDTDTDTDSDSDLGEPGNTDDICEGTPYYTNWEESAEGWTASGGWQRCGSDSTCPSMNPPPWGGDHMMFGYLSAMDYDAPLTSPEFDLSNCSTASVEFDLYLDDNSYADGTNQIVVECLQGEWHELYTLHENTTDGTLPTTVSESMDICTGPEPSLFRIRATGDNADYLLEWSIDDVIISGSDLDVDVDTDADAGSDGGEDVPDAG